MIKTNIKMRVTLEQSIKVQEICFKNDINWTSGKGNVQFIDKPFLFIDEYISFMVEEEAEDFLKEENEEIDPELFIRTNGTCIEKAYKSNFKDYGFEGNFEGEILKEYENHFVGMVYQNEGNLGRSWDKKGKCLQAKGFGYIDMDLKPIEKEEYQKPIQYQIGIDTFQRAKANLTKDELIACIKFNIDKYNWRKKGQDIEDFKKIIDYANFAIEVLRGDK